MSLCAIKYTQSTRQSDRRKRSTTIAAKYCTSRNTRRFRAKEFGRTANYQRTECRTTTATSTKRKRRPAARRPAKRSGKSSCSGWKKDRLGPTNGPTLGCAPSRPAPARPAGSVPTAQAPATPPQGCLNDVLRNCLLPVFLLNVTSSSRSTSGTSRSSYKSRSRSPRSKRGNKVHRSRHGVSPSVIVNERKAANERAALMNPPAPRKKASSPSMFNGNITLFMKRRTLKLDLKYLLKFFFLIKRHFCFTFYRFCENIWVWLCKIITYDAWGANSYILEDQICIMSFVFFRNIKLVKGNEMFFWQLGNKNVHFEK